MSGRGRPWTEAEVGALRDLAPGHTLTECAELLGRHPSSVRTKAAGLGLRLLGQRPEAAPATLREEIAAAKREALTAPLYRGGRGWPE